MRVDIGRVVAGLVQRAAAAQDRPCLFPAPGRALAARVAVKLRLRQREAYADVAMISSAVGDLDADVDGLAGVSHRADPAPHHATCQPGDGVDPAADSALRLPLAHRHLACPSGLRHQRPVAQVAGPDPQPPFGHDVQGEPGRVLVDLPDRGSIPAGSKEARPVRPATPRCRCLDIGRYIPPRTWASDGTYPVPTYGSRSPTGTNGTSSRRTRSASRLAADRGTAAPKPCGSPPRPPQPPPPRPRSAAARPSRSSRRPPPPPPPPPPPRLGLAGPARPPPPPPVPAGPSPAAAPTPRPPAGRVATGTSPARATRSAASPAGRHGAAGDAPGPQGEISAGRCGTGPPHPPRSARPRRPAPRSRRPRSAMSGQGRPRPARPARRHPPARPVPGPMYHR